MFIINVTARIQWRAQVHLHMMFGVAYCEYPGISDVSFKFAIAQCERSFPNEIQGQRY